MKTRVLVVDDELPIRTVIAHQLEARGHEVVIAGDGEEALRIYERAAPDLIVLDLMMPDLDGFEVCRRIRKHSWVPIIILSVKGDEVDRNVGFRLGADDFMIKPFSPRELALRVEAILRRTCADHDGEGSEETLVVGELTLDQATRTVTVQGRLVELTSREFELLRALASRPGVPLSRKQLLAQVWDEGDREYPDNLTALISRLRDKVEPDPDHPRYIVTVRSIGYKFQVPGEN